MIFSKFLGFKKVGGFLQKTKGEKKIPSWKQDLQKKVISNGRNLNFLLEKFKYFQNRTKKKGSNFKGTTPTPQSFLVLEKKKKK